MQKNHSSFPIDVATGLTRDEVIAAENDPTGVQGQLGTHERELWKYRNLFDQWALDNVQLEVRLNVPEFTLVASNTLNTTTGVGIGGINVLVTSPAPGSWVEFTSGDGTQDFPGCKAPAASFASNNVAVALSKSGYVHAVACLSVNGLLIGSYPVRSSRFLVRAIKPTFTSAVDISQSVDTWTIELKCTNCEFMKYVIVPLVGENGGFAFVPSCTFGTEVKATTGKVSVTFNAKLRVVACGTDLLPSKLVESDNFVVHPRAPIFTFVTPATTITGLMDLTISPPSPSINQSFGIAYSIVKTDKHVPTCNSTLSSGEIKLIVKVYDVIQAVACCVGVICADSAIATWGPLDVQVVKPTYNTACSTIKPLTLIVDFAAVTANATVRYQILSAGTKSSLTCSFGSLYKKPVEASEGVVRLWQ